MKGKKIAKMFESLPKFETYSHYNSTLEKIFKSNSLKNFIQTMKNQKEITEISLMDQISKVNTDEPIDIYAEDNNDLKKINNYEEIDIFDEINEENHPNKKKGETKHDSWHNIQQESRKKKYKPELDPFKYNPNYNSIYKNIPSFKIMEPKNSLMTINTKRINKKIIHNNNNKEKNKDKNNEKHLITETNAINKNNNKNKSNNNSPLKKSKVLNTISNFNEPEKKNVKLPKIKLFKNKIFDSLYSDSDNHAMRFSKYIPRKYNIPNHNNIVSYINPIDYIKPRNKNRSIDFDKMLHRSEKNMVYVSRLKNPSFGQYNPKYTYIDKNENVRLFNPEEKTSLTHKKFLMRKLWASYNVITQYQMVDNDKINSN